MNNCFFTTQKILNLFKIKHTTQYLKDCILTHQHYNSLLSIADTLEKYSIESLPVNINWSKLIKVPLPCIIQVEVNTKTNFFVLSSISKNKVSYFNNQNKLVSSSKKEFLEIWTGVCLLIETNEKSGEIDIDKKLKSKRVLDFLKIFVVILVPAWAIVSLFSSEIIADSTLTIYTVFYTALKIAGIITAIFLLWLEIDQFNTSLQKYCSGNNKKVNCNSVLSSKHSKLFYGTISLSILGFSYFFGTTVYLIINNFSFASLSILSILSIINIPVIIISVYYQGLIIKQWCKFCLIIQVLLTGEIIVSFLSRFYKITPHITELFSLLFLLITPILFWKLLKPLLTKKKEIYTLKSNFKKIKYNKNVFESFLIKSKKIETPTNGLGISLNSKSAKFNIIKVCNPYCPPCAKAHATMEKLLDKGKINLQILFTATNDPKDIKAKPVSHFLAIDSKGNKVETKNALDDWYNANKKDYEVLRSKYPIAEKGHTQKNKINDMRIWCDKEKITHTPTIFINGYQLPKEYSVDDLVEILK